MSVVIFFDFGLRDVDRRIGDLRIVLDDVRNGAGYVGIGDALFHFEIRNVHSLGDQRDVFGQVTLLNHLVFDEVPNQRRGGIFVYLGHEIAHDRRVEGSCVGIRESGADHRRDERTVHHVDLLVLADLKSRLFEAGLPGVLHDQRLPYLVFHILLLLGRKALRSVHGLQGFRINVDLIGEFGVTDFLAVDRADFHFAIVHQLGSRVPEIAQQKREQSDSDHHGHDNSAPGP